MKNGKLSEGVYMLTVGPTGRTLVRAKMVKAIAKKVQEVMQQEEEAPIRWYSGAELLAEYGIPTSRLYNHRDAIQQYISKPDGTHYRYHEDMLADAAVMELLTRPVRYRNTNKRAVAAAVLARMKANAAATQRTEETVEAPVQEVVVTPAVEQEASTRPHCRPVRCKETGLIFPSIRAAARAVGRSASTIQTCVKHGRACGDHRFEYV